MKLPLAATLLLLMTAGAVAQTMPVTLCIPVEDSSSGSTTMSCVPVTAANPLPTTPASGSTQDVVITNWPAALGAVDDAPYSDPTGAADGTMISLLKGVYVQNAQALGLLGDIKINTTPP